MNPLTASLKRGFVTLFVFAIVCVAITLSVLIFSN